MAGDSEPHFAEQPGEAGPDIRQPPVERALVQAEQPGRAVDRDLVARDLRQQHPAHLRRQVEALARRAAEGPKPVKAKPAPSEEGTADVAALQQDLADALGLSVQLNDRAGKGELTIRYGSLEQLDDLCRRLMRG